MTWRIVGASGGYSTSQRYQCLAAQNLSGGGWPPHLAAEASVRDRSDIAIKVGRNLWHPCRARSRAHRLGGVAQIGRRAYRHGYQHGQCEPCAAVSVTERSWVGEVYAAWTCVLLVEPTARHVAAAL